MNLQTLGFFDIAREFARWWLEELRVTVGAKDRIPLPLLVARDGEPHLVLGDREAPADPQGLERLAKGLAGCEVVVSTSDCLRRSLSLPPASRGKILAMANLDLERTTPLRRDQVFVGLRVESYDRETRRLAVIQYAASRERVAKHLERARERELPIAGLMTFEDDDPTRPAVALRSPAEEGRSRLSSRARRLMALWGAAACLAGLAFFLHSAEQRAALATLERAIEAEKPRAKQVLDAVEDENAKARAASAVGREISAYRPFVVTLDHLTRLLPDEAFLRSLTLDGDRLEVSGYAPSAAAIVKLIGTDPRFSDPELTSPVTRDREHNKEQFTIAFSIKAN